MNRLSRWGSIGCFALLPCAPLAAQTYVWSDITADTTWSAGNSPYIVIGDIAVGSGATLSIEPGVTVAFAPGVGLTVGAPDTGVGTLRARGEALSPILFTSEDPDPPPGAWRAITFAELAADAAFDQGGVYVSGSILEHCVVRFGGGAGAPASVVIAGSAPFLSGTTIERSGSRGLHATIAPGRPLRADGCAFLQNAGAGVDGGGAYIKGSAPAHLRGCTFAENAGRYGGGLYIEAAYSTIRESLFAANLAEERGGGAFVYNGSHVTFTDCEFSANAAESPDGGTTWGGGLYTEANDTSVYRSRFAGNTSSGRAALGGALGSFSRRLYLADCRFEGNSALATQTIARGGAILQNPDNGGHVVLRCEFVDNLALSEGGDAVGGAIEIGEARVQACRFEGNAADTSSGLGAIKGGALAAQDEAFLAVGNVFVGNRAGSVDGQGGAVYQGSEDADYRTNTFAENIAGAAGGAVFIDARCSLAGSPLLFNRFDGNSAPEGSAVHNGLPFYDTGFNDVPASYACWGTTDLVEIEDSIYHYLDDSSRSVVGYWPLADCDAVCVADWEGDGDVDSADVLALLSDFAAQDPGADVNGDGVVDTRDVILFLQLWAGGC